MQIWQKNTLHPVHASIKMIYLHTEWRVTFHLRKLALYLLYVEIKSENDLARWNATNSAINMHLHFLLRMLLGPPSSNQGLCIIMHKCHITVQKKYMGEKKHINQGWTWKLFSQIRKTKIHLRIMYSHNEFEGFFFMCKT